MAALIVWSLAVMSLALLGFLTWHAVVDFIGWVKHR
jgi:hypothetical protein